jgi:hypothetical protein
LAFARAFQINAFQDNAFQVHNHAQETLDPGSRIVAGTFSRGQWRDLQRDLEARRLEAKRKREAAAAALEAERLRDFERIAAEIAARRSEEDATLIAKLKGLWSQGLNPQGLTAADMAAAQSFHANRLAKLAQAKREAEEEEEALALLMQ